MLRAVLALGLVSSPLAFAGAVRATGAAEVADPEGDVVITGPKHGLDVVKVAFESDGTRLTISATTKGELEGLRSEDPVVVYIDADNRSDTGRPAAGTAGERVGFEFRINLQVCSEYFSGMTICNGSLTGGGLTNVYPVASVDALHGSGDRAVRRGSDAVRGTAVDGVLKVGVAYADLGLRPGSTVRILAKEGHAKDGGLLPVLVLTLK